ncbi:MAG: leucine-rich repeat protein [Blautia sp.]
MDNGLKSVKMSTAIFIVLTIAVLGFFIAGIGKSTTNQATEGLTISKAEAEGLFANYNNTIVSGTEVQRAITAHEDLCLVKTKKKPTGITLSGAKDASSNNYVNPAARFSAKLEYDSDDNLQHIVFSQVDSSLANDIRDPNLSEPETTPSTETDAPDPTNPLRELIVEQDHDIILLEGAAEPNWKSAGMTVYAVQRNGKKEEVTGYTTNYSSDWRLDEGLAMQVKYMTITYNGIVKNHVPITLAKSIRDIITISTTSTVAGHPITVDGMNADLKFTVTGMDCTLMNGTGNNFTTQTSGNASGTVHIKVEWPVMGETIEFDVTVSKFELVVKNVDCPASSGIMVGDQMTYTTNATATFSDTAPYLSNGPAIAQPASGSAISKVGAQAGAVTVTATDTVSGFTVSDTRTVYDAVTLDSPVTVKAGQSYQFTNNTNIQFSPQANLGCTKSGSTYTVTPSKVRVYNVVGKLPDLGNREVSFQLIATNPNWEYTIDNNRATLTKYIGGASSVTIPSKVEDPWVSGGVPVVAAVETFSHNTTLQSVQFEPGVQNLKWTFFDCPNLRSVGALPNTVTSMYGTFQKCSGLASVPAIPGSVTEIPYVFAECTSLTVTPHLGDQIRSMYAAFANNPNLTTVTNIPANLTDLAECFSGCTSLRGEIPLIPSSVTKMYGSFYHCDNAVVYIDNSESNVDHGVAFRGVNREVEHYWLWDEWDWQYNGSNIDLIKYKGNQSYVKVPRLFRGRTVVGLQGAFQNNGRITGAIIPATVSNLDNTFNGCAGLVTAPTIPYGVTTMQSTFANCSNLTTASEIPGSVTNLFRCFQYDRALTTPPAINNGPTNMCGTFESCSSLRAAPPIPNSVTNLTWTFVNCSSLQHGPSIGTGVTDMTSAFQGCVSMQQPPIINSTSVKIMSYCFKDCYAMVAPPTISHIKALEKMDWAFQYCNTMTVMPTLPGSVRDAGGSFNGCTALSSVQPIPFGVTTIAYAFQGCTSLANAPDISGTVQNMSHAFDGCTNLVKATAIPDSATDLDHTFSGCVKLAAVPYIGTSVQYMPYTFYDCNSLTSCGWIPANVRGMSHTFENCDNIATTPAINNNWVAWDYTFRDCYKLSAITAFPTGSDNMNGAFFNCWSITSMPTVPNNYTKIYSTFYNCCNVTIYVDNEAPNVYIDGNTFFRVPEYHFLRSEWSYTTGNKYGSATLTGYKGSSHNPKVPRDIGGQVITSMEHTFQGNSNITGADLNNGYLRRMYGTFENCTSLTTMPTIPYGVEEMPTTFQYCSNLTTLTALPSTVRTMNGTFGFCRSLTSAPSIPYGVTTMEHCFRECTSLKSFTRNTWNGY